MKCKSFYNFDPESPIDNPFAEMSPESVTIPALALSVKEIYERWKRNQPLDVITRNGSFAMGEEDADNFDMIDLDTLDLSELQELAGKYRLTVDEFLRRAEDLAPKKDTNKAESVSVSQTERSEVSES